MESAGGKWGSREAALVEPGGTSSFPWDWDSSCEAQGLVRTQFEKPWKFEKLFQIILCYTFMLTSKQHSPVGTKLMNMLFASLEKHVSPGRWNSRAKVCSDLSGSRRAIKLTKLGHQISCLRTSITTSREEQSPISRNSDFSKLEGEMGHLYNHNGQLKGLKL